MNFKIALRNILRNKRRSQLTMLAIAVGAIAIVLFGEYVAFIKAGLETTAVRSVGHLTVHRVGYIDYGAGNPARFAIDDYSAVIRTIREDAEIAPKINVITPTISLTGIAGNFDIDASKTFFGAGFVPSDRERMQQWDPHHVRRRPLVSELTGLRDDDETRGVVGVGLARVLGLCEALHLDHCPPRPVRVASPAGVDGTIPLDLAAIGARERVYVLAPKAMPRLDLLAATAGGAPNVVGLYVNRAEAQGARELDDNFVAMHFGLAQRLLFGQGQQKAVGIVLQLHRTEDMVRVHTRLAALFEKNGLDLEIHEFAELQPFYRQATGMFSAIFGFISLIMGVIVLFTVVNTVGMSVMERTVEIGTARAMGVRRAGIRKLFVTEGALLGTIGATCGVLLAQLFATLFNLSGVTWTPPGQAAAVPLMVMTSGVTGLLVRVWLGLIIMATIAAVIPANRAARLKVVDALRHV